ncbi:hypothetical protein [Paracoccus sp. S3-43]|uniref:COG4223 family protein n=1 Tax=Paracoccus sp. S3-43 TaxID=3030011 RepID=UPI0023AF97D0|nr:hypothetical protein [Paracoccus sp. S3-43]WEF25015.1 hypothetical protein PXD02_03385 [Paracoccus sp. S3-43]
MKKPDKTESDSHSETPQDKTPLMLKKDAAEPGVIAQSGIGAGDGASAAPAGGEIKPIESTLLGDKTGQNPAAARKSAAKPADQPAQDKAAAVAKDAPKEAPPKDVPPAPMRETAAPAPAQKVTVQKTGFWPVVLGGVVAAGLGSAATIWALPHLPAAWLPEPPAAAAPAPDVDIAAIRSEAVSAAEAATAERIDALRAELAAAPPVAAPDAPAGPSVEDLAALRQQIEDQGAQIRDLSARPQIDPDLAARVQTLAEQADTLEQQLQTAAQAAQAQINAAQAEAQQLQQAAAESTRRAEAVAAIAALQSALDRGIAPDEARQTLEGAGLQAPEALTREVPSLDSLQAGFPEAARAALRTSLRQDSATGNGSLFGNFIRAQTGARSIVPREGTDPDAVLSRADAAVQEGRIADAVTEIGALPDDARAAPAMAEWLAGATAYRDAQAALSDLSAPAN